MAYIGNQPALQYITFAKQTFTANGSTVAFTLNTNAETNTTGLAKKVARHNKLIEDLVM